MGVSTNAILAFGFDLGEELPESLRPEDDEYFDWWKWIDKYLGIEDAEYNVRSDARADFPVDLISYCSNEYPMYFIAVNGTESVVHRGYVEDVETPAIPQEKIDAMRAFCESQGIDWQEPKWRMMSYWG